MPLDAAVDVAADVAAEAAVPPPSAADRADLGRASRGGLCAACRHARLVRSARAQLFLRCDQPGLPRYPTLPVIACDGFTLRPPA